MKYEWKIHLILKNGVTVSGEYKCDHVNSLDVGKELLCGEINTFDAIMR